MSLALSFSLYLHIYIFFSPQTINASMLFPRKTEILSHDHSTIIEIRKLTFIHTVFKLLTLLRCYQLFSIANEKHVPPGPGSDSRSHVAVSFHVSFPFILSFSFMTLTFLLQSTGQLFCKMFLSWGLMFPH